MCVARDIGLATVTSRLASLRWNHKCLGASPNSLAEALEACPKKKVLQCHDWRPHATTTILTTLREEISLACDAIFSTPDASPSYATECLHTRRHSRRYQAPHPCRISLPFLQQARLLYADPNLPSPRPSSRVLPAGISHPATTKRNMQRLARHSRLLRLVLLLPKMLGSIVRLDCITEKE